MNEKQSEGESYVRRQAKASSAGSSEGGGKSRGLFRRAHAPLAASGNPKGSGASSRRVALLSLLALAATVVFGVSPASAAAPTVTLNSINNPTYTTVDVHGEIDPMGEPIGWYVEKSTDGENWEGTSLGGFIDSSQVSGPQPAEGTVDGLTAGQHYFFRLAGANYNDSSEVRSGEPYPEATTDSIPAPTVTIDPVGTFTATTAQFVGHIDPNPPAGSPEASDVHWHFECTPECPGIGDEQTVAADAGSTEVKADAAGLEPNTHYEVRLVGKNAGPKVSSGPVEFTTSASAPDVQTLPAFAIRGGTEALVGGSINPRNSATAYWVEYGPTTGYGQKMPLATPADAGSGGQLEYFTEHLTGLTPSTIYHVRLVAENDAGQHSEGVDQNFETAPASDTIQQGCPNATLRVENDSTALPDCRAYERVSPAEKNGFEVGFTRERSGGFEGYVASENGARVTFESPGAFGDSKSAFATNPYLSSRTTSGWTTHALAPAIPPQPSISYVNLSWYTPDLQKAAITVPGGFHLSEGDFPGQNNIYLEDTITGDFKTLNVGTIPPGGNGLVAFGGSADGKIVFFSATDPLLDGAPSPFIISLYEWSGGQLRLASVMPNGSPSLTGGTITMPSGSRNVSRDGSRLMFQGEGQLVLREDGQSYAIAPPNGNNRLVGATPDLASIFFVSEEALTSDAADDAYTKLYRFNSESKTITLISPNAPGGGNVGSVRGVSPDGSYVYFRSEARYSPNQGIKGQYGPTNLYMWHNGTITFIGTELAPSSDEATSTFASSLNFRVSPNGKFVSFASIDRLTSYDNTDTTPGPSGEVRADSEVYVYDADAKRLTCVSCNPSGMSPTGTVGGADAGSTFSRPPDRQPQNQQRGVGDDGQMFFESRDSLVTADVNGVKDVYEWRRGQPHLISSGTGSDPAAYAAASLSGDDVFFYTRQQLVRSDRDRLSDLYDARVGGGFALAAETSSCEALDSCHGPESRTPSEPSSGSLSTTPETRADPARLRLRNALRTCKHKPKAKRAKCRAAARRKLKKVTTGRTH